MTHSLTNTFWATDIAGMPVDVANRQLAGTTPPPPSFFKPMTDEQRALAQTAQTSDDWLNYTV